MKIKQSMTRLQHKQRGATLFTSLVFLTLMTIVTVSAAKLGSLDVLLSGNNQQQMLVFQQTDKTLIGFSNPVVVIAAVDENRGVKDKWSKTIPTQNYEKRELKNRNLTYPCKDSGLATGLGGDAAGQCYLFDLSAEDKLANGGLTDKHFRGVGKLLPNTSNYTE